MQKALLKMNVQLTEVRTDVMDGTGQVIVRDLVAGVRKPLRLARHRPSPTARGGEPSRHRTGRTRHLARGASIRAEGGAGDIRRHRPASGRVRRQAWRRCWTSRRRYEWISARRIAPPARCVEHDIRLRLTNRASVDLTHINELGMKSAAFGSVS